MCYFQCSDTREGILVFQIPLLPLPLRHIRVRSGALFSPIHKDASFHTFVKKDPNLNTFNLKDPPLTCKRRNGIPYGCRDSQAEPCPASSLPQLRAQVTALVGRYGVKPGFGPTRH